MSNTSQLSIYRIYDGGEYWWYSAESDAEAMKFHEAMMNDGDGFDPKDCSSPTKLADDESKLLHDTSDEPPYSQTKTWKEWAEWNGPGLLCSTCY